MEKNKGGQPSEKNSSHDARGSLKLKDLGIEKNRAHDVPGTPSLKDLGIHKKQSQRWQQNTEANGEEQRQQRQSVH